MGILLGEVGLPSVGGLQRIPSAFVFPQPGPLSPEEQGPGAEEHRTENEKRAPNKVRVRVFGKLRGQDLNLRPLGYEPNELPDCSTPQAIFSEQLVKCQFFRLEFAGFSGVRRHRHRHRRHPSHRCGGQVRRWE